MDSKTLQAYDYLKTEFGIMTMNDDDSELYILLKNKQNTAVSSPVVNALKTHIKYCRLNIIEKELLHIKNAHYLVELLSYTQSLIEKEKQNKTLNKIHNNISLKLTL